MKKFIIFILLISSSPILSTLTAQEKTGNNFTREQVLKMSTEDLSSLALDDLMKVMDIAGVTSMEELYELLLNKDVTSASKKAESVFEAPLSTTVLSGNQIIASGATCIEEAFRLIPGIIVREKANGVFDVHLRGLDNVPPNNLMIFSENINTLVMIDGRQVFNYAMGGILWESLPVSIVDIDRIEVVRGPSTALYGPNAVTGVINIITKHIDKSSPLISANLQGGNLSTYVGDLAVRKAINDKLSIGISGNYQVRRRVSDELYVFNEKQSFSKEEFDTLTFVSGNKRYTYKDPNDDIDELFADPGLARENYGVNGYVGINPSNNVNMNISCGYQYSYSNNITLGDNATVINGRESSTGYFNLVGSIYKFHLQANYMGGVQDFEVGNNGFKNDMGQFNGSLEYDLQYKNLTVRPGVSYMSATYDDRPYLKVIDGKTIEGYYNNKVNLNVFSGNVRFDYLAFEKLRLVAAIRAEKYSHPDKWNLSWQYIASYKINDNNNIRVVYSRANRSPFLMATHSNFVWDREGRPAPNYIHFMGNKESKLMTSDMVELGYRIRPAKSVLIDFEAFYSTGKDFVAMNPDSTNFSIPITINPTTHMPTPTAYPVVSAYLNFDSQEITSKQMGATVSIDWIISKKLVLNTHLTVQQTKLDNFNPVSRDETIGMQVNEIYPMDGSNGMLTEEIIKLFISGQIPAYPDATTVSVTSDWQNTKLESDFEHKATPTYWGGISIDYKPTEKLKFFTNTYFYGEQTFLNQYDTYEIPSKFIVSLKASYDVAKGASLFFNARNVLNNKSTEFAFMDESRGLYLLGLNLHF